MQIDTLSIRNFRCIESADLTPAGGINCIVGDNASGKTSLLETVFILGRGHSFRQSSLRDAIRQTADALTIRSRSSNTTGQQHRIGAHHNRRGFQIKLDDQAATSRFELVNVTPLQHIDPNVHKLLEQGPQYRRQFLDWGVFHVEHLFFPAWRRYRRAMKQRNRALRHQLPKHDVVAWDAELVQQGEIVDACRRRYIGYLAALLPDSARRLIGEQDLDIHYSAGWRGNEGLGVALARSLAQDYRAGFTQQGPHRADLKVSVANSKARDWVSRGQQKILTSCLLLCQATILRRHKNIQPILLIDDLAAELGQSYRAALAEEIIRVGGQCFLTFLDDSSIPAPLQTAHRFHVEQGRITSAFSSSSC